MTTNTLFNQNIIFHGADYNPEQWLDYPDILEKDIQMMKECNCTVMSVGIFSWSVLEKQEGDFDFSFLENVINKLYENGIKVFLATPSGARPQWLAQKYPEVLRVDRNRVRQLFGKRHNHCPSSTIYRQKVAIINEQLAKRFAHHPGVLAWHISNEYGGECHCPLCQEKFREFLKDKYKSIDNLNKAYWSTFWSHSYNDFEQIQSPSDIGESDVHALNLDWKRFTTKNVIDFFEHEKSVVKKFNPNLKVTTNFMEFFYDYDYFEFAKSLDFISWDSYPKWHFYKDEKYTASYTAMNHDLMRSYKMQPFVLMESTPSSTNWRELSVLKKPKMHRLSSIQALAHGADSIQYFQWRKSRGSSEKLHGAVVDHVGHIQTRVGQDVKNLGLDLLKYGPIAGSYTNSKVALVFDTQNRWAIDDCQGPRNMGFDYLKMTHSIYQALWSLGINVDVIDQSCILDKYKIVFAPVNYMLRDNWANKVESFVKQGGFYVSSYFSGYVDENDLCYLGGFPGPLKDVLGIWEEEIDSLPDDEYNLVQFSSKDFNYTKEYKARELCSLIHTTTAKSLAYFKCDFYKNYCAVSVNEYGKGRAYHISSYMEDDFYYDFISTLLDELKIHNILGIKSNDALHIQTRENEQSIFVFVQNFNNYPKDIMLNDKYLSLDTNNTIEGGITLEPYEVLVLKKDK